MLQILEREQQLDITENNKIVLYFSAVWCGPCKTFGPIVEFVSQTYPDVKFVKVDIDDHVELVNQYNIRGVPSVVLLKDQENVASRTGSMPQSQLAQLVRTTFSLE